MTAERPILVTGSHRSGTTWVGRILSLSGEAEPIHEPFNPALYRSWLSHPPERWFSYVDPTERGQVRDDLARVLRLRPAFFPMLRRAGSTREWGGVLREHVRAAAARITGRRPLLKDPIAFFATEWLFQEFAVEPIVLVRHPAAFASSLKRLNWAFDFANLWEQPDLISRHLRPFRTELRAAVDGSLDIMDQSILLWRMLNHVALAYKEAHPDWIVCRYEDLAADPLARFEGIYERLGLLWSDGVAADVLALTARSNRAEVPDGDRGGVRRDSRAAMWTWTFRLTPQEIERVREGTADVARAWYVEEDWRPPDVTPRLAS